MSVEDAARDRLSDERAVAAIVVDIADAFDGRDQRMLGELVRYARWHVEPAKAVFVGTRGRRRSETGSRRAMVACRQGSTT
jgi:hypothetical protein